jgi:hypothetical protein
MQKDNLYDFQFEEAIQEAKEHYEKLKRLADKEN